MLVHAVFFLHKFPLTWIDNKCHQVTGTARSSWNRSIRSRMRVQANQAIAYCGRFDVGGGTSRKCLATPCTRLGSGVSDYEIGVVVTVVATFDIGACRPRRWIIRRCVAFASIATRSTCCPRSPCTDQLVNSVSVSSESAVIVSWHRLQQHQLKCRCLGTINHHPWVSDYETFVTEPRRRWTVVLSPSFNIVQKLVYCCNARVPWIQSPAWITSTRKYGQNYSQICSWNQRVNRSAFRHDNSFLTNNNKWPKNWKRHHDLSSFRLCKSTVLEILIEAQFVLVSLRLPPEKWTSVHYRSWFSSSSLIINDASLSREGNTVFTSLKLRESLLFARWSHTFSTTYIALLTTKLRSNGHRWIMSMGLCFNGLLTPDGGPQTSQVN